MSTTGDYLPTYRPTAHGPLARRPAASDFGRGQWVDENGIHWLSDGTSWGRASAAADRHTLISAGHRGLWVPYMAEDFIRPDVASLASSPAPSGLVWVVAGSNGIKLSGQHAMLDSAVGSSGSTFGEMALAARPRRVTAEFVYYGGTPSVDLMPEGILVMGQYGVDIAQGSYQAIMHPYGWWVDRVDGSTRHALASGRFTTPLSQDGRTRYQITADWFPATGVIRTTFPGGGDPSAPLIINETSDAQWPTYWETLCAFQLNRGGALGCDVHCTGITASGPPAVVLRTDFALPVSDTNMHDITGLAMRIPANSVYRLMIVQHVDGPTTARYKSHYTATGGATIKGGRIGLISTAAATTGSVTDASYSATGTPANTGLAGIGTPVMVVDHLLVTAGASQCQFQVQGSQSVSDPGVVTVEAGSFIHFEQVA